MACLQLIVTNKDSNHSLAVVIWANVACLATQLQHPRAAVGTPGAQVRVDVEASTAWEEFLHELFLCFSVPEPRYKHDTYNWYLHL